MDIVLASSADDPERSEVLKLDGQSSDQLCGRPNIGADDEEVLDTSGLTTGPLGFIIADSSQCYMRDGDWELSAMSSVDDKVVFREISADQELSGSLPIDGAEQSSQTPLIHPSLSCVMHSFDEHIRPVRMICCSSDEFSTGENFTKGCKWSPDGLCVLTSSNDNCLRLFDLPAALCSTSRPSEELLVDLPELKSVLRVQEAETVYDFCWYPLMSSSNPATCCFVTTTRQNPVHMWDAFNGQLRCSYRAYDHVDEIVSASSLAFNCSGEKLYCGFNKMIRVFDVAIPGRCFQERPTKNEGQPGIISCIAVNPADEKIYAAGSYLKTIAVYAEPLGSQIFRVEGQVGGVTHLIFSKDGQKLFSGGRKDPEIVCWDMRNPGRILFSLQRDVITNQRIYFDLDETGTYAVSGNNDGCVTAWDLTRLPIQSAEDQQMDCEQKEVVLQPVLKFRAHDDCVNGVSLNPLFPIVATSSGQRKFAELIDDEDSDDFFSKISNVGTENSLALWWAGRDCHL